jgi:CubicO group peptidase (beta-lactamase class C family)
MKSSLLPCSLLLLSTLSFVLLLTPVSAIAMTSLDDLLRPYLEEYGLPALAACVTKNGEIVAAGAVGSRRAGTETPVTLHDKFHLGSDTKAMTALLAAMLVEEGKLRWDSTPAGVFPEFKDEMNKQFSTITLEQILSHTAGLPSDNEETIAVWEKALFQDGNLDAMRRYIVREWSKKTLTSLPGEHFEYSNMGYVIAGAMIERAVGKTWEELMTQRIFEPLGLTTAGFGCQSSPGKVDAPLGHAVVDGKLKSFLNGPNADNPSIIGPAGLVHLSILDFARWAAWNAGDGKRDPALVTPQTLRRLHAPHIAFTPPKDAKPGTPDTKGGYALGWGVIEVDFAPHPLLQHNGSNNKNVASILVDEKADLAIVLATNIGGNKADEALKALAKALYLANTAAAR